MIDFSLFKRDVIFFKTIAMAHLFSMYLTTFDFDAISVLMIFCGFSLSASAALALGVDQTYFGVELGEVKPNFVFAFPYNSIPHPMIVGSMIGLLGVHKMASFRVEFPYAIPMHCVMYCIHMVQEHVNDIYASNWHKKKRENSKKRGTSRRRGRSASLRRRQ